MSSTKTSVYFMPGMAANYTIFNRIRLPLDTFDVHYLNWVQPERNQTIEAYAAIICKQIIHKNPVLVGVSFGGLIIQEISKIIPVKKVVLISSIKSYLELSTVMRFARVTKIYKLVPTSLAQYLEVAVKYTSRLRINRRLLLYKKHLSIRDAYYLDWCIANLIAWKQEQPIKNSIQIHGSSDHIFPLDKIQKCITIEGGTHAMIIYRAKWFNTHLPSIILD